MFYDTKNASTVKLSGREILDICNRARTNILAHREKRKRDVALAKQKKLNTRKWYWPWGKTDYTLEEAAELDSHDMFSEMAFAEIAGGSTLRYCDEFDAVISDSRDLDKELQVDVEILSILKGWAK